MATTRLLSAMVATWNNVATTFTGLKLNVTDTASAVGSLLMDLQVNSSPKFGVNKFGGINVYGNLALFSNAGSVFFGTGLDLVITRDAANTLALRNGTAAQSFNLYNTYTDASNYERGVFDWAGTANTLRIGTEAAGTGTVRNIQLVAGSNSVTMTPGASNLLTLNGGLITGSSIVAPGDASYQLNGRSVLSSPVDGAVRLANNGGTITTDITLSGASGSGASTATFGGGLVAAGSVIAGGNVLAGSVQALGWVFKSLMYSATDGNITLYNNAGTAFSLLQFGGTTSSFPAIKRNAADIEIRLADDSAFASVAMKDITTSNTTFLHATSASLANGAAAQVATMTNGPTAGNPTKWIAINDNGVTRYIPAW